MTRRAAVFIFAVVFALCSADDARGQDENGASFDPVTIAQSAMLQLDQLRAVEANQPQRMLDLMNQGADALATARKHLIDDVPAPSTAPAGRSRKADAAAHNAAAQQRRLGLCQLAFMQAELHRRAAVALPADHPERAKHLEQSLALNKVLRIDYRDLVAGRLGYAGEARVHRARGDLEQADAVLETVAIELGDKRLAQQPDAVVQIQRVLWLERVETALEKSALAGNTMAAELANSILMKDAAPAEQAALKFVVAAASANEAIDENSGDADAIAQQLRDPALAEGSPEHQRLALLVKLAATRGVTLTIPEQLKWARLQSWAGLTEPALATYAAATKAGPADMTPADWIAYGTLLHASGRADAAAEALAKGLDSIPVDSPQRIAALQAIAAGRTQAARETDADDAMRTLAIDALWQLAEAANDPTVRRDALRSWGYLHQRAGTFEQQLPAIEKYNEIVLADPYLCLLVFEAKWRAATVAANSSSATTQPADLARLEQAIRANLTRLLPDAGPDLAPSLVLLMAHAAAATPGGSRAALDMLAQHEPVRKPDAPATPQLLGLKLKLLMDLGLTGEAEALAARLQDDAVPTATALKLADMLADRYAGADSAPSAVNRDQVVTLVSRGLAQRGTDGSYRDSAIAGARTLLKVKAYADAQQILAGLKAAGGSEENDPAVALLLAEALRGQGKIEDAQKLLTAIAATHPQAGEIHLATGGLQQRLQQWEPAAAAYRTARKHLPVGGELWWQATVGLGESLTSQGNTPAAQELLRVANAMYRHRAPATLLPRIDTLLRQPASAGRETSAGTNG